MTKLQKIQDDHYEIIDNGEENFHHIHLKESSPFPEVVYQYGKVQLLEENDSLRVKFEFEIFKNPRLLHLGDEFTEYVGHILMTNLEELLIYNKYKKEQSGV